VIDGWDGELKSRLDASDHLACWNARASDYCLIWTGQAVC